MVDEFGQWKDAEWPGKVASEDELVAYLRDEYERCKTSKGYPNPEWSKYTAAGPRSASRPRAASTEPTTAERWWLVDPDGCAFFSNGVCYGSRMGVHGFVDGMTEMFDFLPPKDDPKFRDAWTTADQIPEFVKRNGAEAGRGRSMFNFARANMIRAFGDDWWHAWHTINTARLREWGFNTISVCVNNYFDERVEDYLNQAAIPFAWTLKSFPQNEPASLPRLPRRLLRGIRNALARIRRANPPLRRQPLFHRLFHQQRTRMARPARDQPRPAPARHA